MNITMGPPPPHPSTAPERTHGPPTPGRTSGPFASEGARGLCPALLGHGVRRRLCHQARLLRHRTWASGPRGTGAELRGGFLGPAPSPLGGVKCPVAGSSPPSAPPPEPLPEGGRGVAAPSSPRGCAPAFETTANVQKLGMGGGQAQIPKRYWVSFPLSPTPMPGGCPSGCGGGGGPPRFSSFWMRTLALLGARALRHVLPPRASRGRQPEHSCPGRPRVTPGGLSWPRGLRGGRVGSNGGLVHVCRAHALCRALRTAGAGSWVCRGRESCLHTRRIGVRRGVRFVWSSREGPGLQTGRGSRRGPRRRCARRRASSRAEAVTGRRVRAPPLAATTVWELQVKR